MKSPSAFVKPPAAIAAASRSSGGSRSTTTTTTSTTTASTFIRLTDRRLIQILVFIAAFFSFTSTTFLHLADLDEQLQQQQQQEHHQQQKQQLHDPKRNINPHVKARQVVRQSQQSSSSSSSSTSDINPTTERLKVSSTAKASSAVDEQKQQQHQQDRRKQKRKNRYEQASLAEWLLEDPYEIVYRKEDNSIPNKEYKHDTEEEDPIEQYRTIFCPSPSIGYKQQREQRRRTDRRKHPVILWGIPSTTSSSETARRQVLRSTYLNYYRLLLSEQQQQQQQQNSNSSRLHSSSSISTAMVAASSYSGGDDSSMVPLLNNPIDQNLTSRAAGRNEIITDRNKSSSSSKNKNKNKNDYNINKFQNRICSFHEWTCNHTDVVDDCQIIYVFFVGAGDPMTAPTELVGLEDGDDYDDENESKNDRSKVKNFRSMLYTGDHVVRFNDGTSSSSSSSVPSPVSQNVDSSFNTTRHLIPIDKHEPGVVYLNIRENQFDGKMTTWFQFASLVEKEYRDEIDYVAKIDSDLLLFTPNFMEWIEIEHLRLHGEELRIAQEEQDEDGEHILSQRYVPPSLTYGGTEFPSTNCEMNATFDHDCPLPLVGRSYMSGELNFMSVDLARYIVSKYCPRSKLTIPHEDVSVSNYVYSYQNNTRYHRHRHRHRLSTVNQGGGQDPIDTSLTTINHTIKIMSVEDKDIMLTKSATADWRNLDFETTERFLDILWGHSIKRGRYQQYLVFKRDNSFVTTWSVFLRRYLPLLGMTLSTKLQPQSPAQKPRPARRQQRSTSLLSQNRKKRTA